MILKFDEFKGKVKSESLDKEEVIDLVSLITEMRPSLPNLFPDEEVSKLIDNINYYTSEDGKYRISVYFRESDVYKNPDGSITYGKFKSLFKIVISKFDSDFKLSEVKDYIILTSEIIKNVYPESQLVAKLNGERISIESLNQLEGDTVIENIGLNIRIF